MSAVQDAFEALRTAERDLADFFENVPIAVHWVGPDGTILRANRAELNLLGYARDEYVGRHIANFHANRDACDEMLRRLRSGLELRQYEIRLRCKNGSIKHGIVDSNGKWESDRLVHFRCVTRDITDQRRADLINRFLADAAADYTCVARFDGQKFLLESASEGFTRITGYTPDEVDVRLAALAIHPDDLVAVVGDFEKLIHGEAVGGEARLITKSGDQRRLRYVAEPSFDPNDPQVLRIFGTAQDVTERDKSLERMQEVERQFRQLADHIGEVFWISDPMRSQIFYCSPAFEPIWGQPIERLRCEPWTWFDSIVHEDRLRFAAALEASVSGQRTDIEYQIARPDGSTRWIRERTFPVTDAAGRVCRVAGIADDFTDRRRAMDALRESEERFARFMQHLPGLAWAKDSQGRYVFANDAALSAFRRSRTDLYGKTDGEIFPAETAAQFTKNDALALSSRGGIQVVETLEHDDGLVHHSIVSKFPVPGGKDEAALVGGVAFDITELKRAEAALRESESRLRLALEAGRMGVWEWNLRTNQIWWSDNLEPIHGLAPGAFRGTLESFEQLIHPEDRPIVREAIQRAIRERSRYQIEFRNLRPDGSIHWMTGVGSVYCDSVGQPERMVGIGMDVTDRRQAEEQLRQADRRKDEFLATLAHELRNPLAPIRNALHLLQLAGDDREIIDQARGVMERQLRQMVRLVDDLLDVSRITRNRLELRSERVELAAVVRSAVEASRPAMESFGHEFTVSLPSEPIYLHADLTRLAQVISNLLNNAAKYTDRGGRIALAAQLEGGDVIISVKDTGIGIPSEHLPQLFEMFSQVTSALERSQGGLGIGLSLVKGLVELHGGTVTANSDGPGRGSEFIVRLPTLAGAVTEEPRPAGENSGLQQRFRILVVDDNRDGADSLSQMLRLMGHETHAVHDGYEAVEAAGWFRPSLVLMDIGLPRLNGYQAAQRIRRESWGTSMMLIAVTGWGQDADKERAKAAGFDHHLVKPVDPIELQRLLVERPARSQ